MKGVIVPRRRSINVEGFAHGTNPTPAASRVGNLIFTGGIFGVDPVTGTVPAGDVGAQTRLIFDLMQRILKAGGATFDDIVKVEFYVKDVDASRVALNPAWEAAFPDPDSRPARHIFVYPALPGNMLIQAHVFAVAPDA